MVQVNSHPSYTNNKECQFLYNILYITFRVNVSPRDSLLYNSCGLTPRRRVLESRNPIRIGIQQLAPAAFIGISDSHCSASKSTLNFRSDTVTCSSASFSVLLDENLVYYVESPFHDAAGAYRLGLTRTRLES